ncbi:MAG: type II secretion system secretin GspD [Candidatus Hydrogenedentes bacterium]|nr:type II secretion system secretin GspD [Candidatus Hydrogenedentota bacterium]
MRWLLVVGIAVLTLVQGGWAQAADDSSAQPMDNSSTQPSGGMFKTRVKARDKAREREAKQKEAQTNAEASTPAEAAAPIPVGEAPTPETPPADQAFQSVPPAEPGPAPVTEPGPSAAVSGPPPGPPGPGGAPGPRQIGTPPTAPPSLPVNEFRPKSGEMQTEPIRLDFDNLDLGLVIQMLAPMIGKTFDVDQQVAAQKVTVVSHDEIPADMVYYVLESILASRGMKMIETVDGHLVKIRPVAEDVQDAPMVTDGKARPEGYDNYSYHIVNVQHSDPVELSTILPKVGSKQALVHVYAKTGTLILYDTATGIRNMLDLLELVDIPGYDEDVEFFWLKFTRAEVISEQIQQVLMGPEGEGAAAAVQNAPAIRTPSTVSRLQRQPPGQGQSTVVSSELSLRMVPDERLNALIVVASRPLMDQVRDLIEKLDTPTAPELNNMHVRPLLHADAEAMETALNSMLGGTSSRTSSSQSGSGQGASGSMGGGGGGGGGGMANTEVQPFEKQVTITRYDQTNSLLIIASPQDFKVLDSVIAQLDVPPRQVHVEAQILEVSIGDRYRLSVESAGLTANDYFALNGVVNLANVLTQGPLGALENTDDILSLGIIDDTTTLTIPDGNGGVVTQEVPNIPLLLTALESLTSLDVLSRPSLTTVDNEEAHILDGQEVPVIRGSQRSLDTSVDTNSSVFNTTDRRDVGISLTVTPQISEGDYVFLELEVKVERPIQSTVGLDPNLVGPTFSKSEIVNKVVVRDGSTGVLGGLISEATDRSRRQTPLLGDIPGLGWLFRRKDDQRTKRNLVVLLTPHIMKEGIDYDRKTQAEIDYSAKANADILFEKGFIKKIDTKRDMRNNYRPTDAALEEAKSKDKFKRGDVEK